MPGAGGLADETLLAVLCRSGELGGEVSDTEWGRFVEAAHNHGVAPLLYKRLLHGGVSVPKPVLEQLRQWYLVNAARNTLLYQALGRVLQAFQQAAIPVLPLKGAHLAALVYGDVASRKMGDLDLLVRKSELPRAASKLLEMGYTNEINGDAESIAAWCAKHPDRHHLPIFHKLPDTRIELHWSLLDPPHPVELADPWSRARPAIIAGVEAMVLAPEDLLLHLCLHAEHHHFRQGIRPLCDIAEVVHRWGDKLDWAYVQAQADRWRAGRCVYLGLWLSRELLRSPVPEAILRGLQPQDFKVASVLAREIVLSGTEELDGEERAALAPWSLQISQPGRGRFGGWRWFWNMMFPSREHMAGYMQRRHGLSLSGLRRYSCYITRAIDVLVRMGRFWLHCGRKAIEGVRELRKTARLRKWLRTREPEEHSCSCKS